MAITTPRAIICKFTSPINAPLTMSPISSACGAYSAFEQSRPSGYNTSFAASLRHAVSVIPNALWSNFNVGAITSAPVITPMISAIC